MEEYKVTTSDKIALKIQEIKPWFTLKRIILLSLALVIIAVGIILLVKVNTNPEYVVKRAFSRTYSIENIADSFGINSGVGFADVLREFLENGGNIKAEIKYTYPEEDEYNTFKNTRELNISKDNKSKVFDLTYYDTYNGSFENVNTRESYFPMIFNPEDGSSYKEYNSFHICADDEYTYYSYDDLDAWFRIENENVIRNYNKSIYTKWLGPIDDGFDFSVDYFSGSPFYFSNTNKEITETTGAFDALLTIINDTEISSQGKCKIKLGTADTVCKQYRITVPQNDIRQFFTNYSNQLDELYNSEDAYRSYSNSIYDLYFQLYDSLCQWKELASKVSNDGTIDLYIKSGRIVRVNASFFINDNGEFYSVDLSMDNLGEKNVLDEVKCEINLDEGGMKTQCELIKDKKIKDTKVTDSISYSCKCDSGVYLEDTNKDIKIVYNKDNGDFSIELSEKTSIGNVSDTQQTGNSSKRETEQKRKVDGNISKTADSLSITVNNCNIYYLSVFENVIDEKEQTEHDYSMSGSILFSKLDDSLETESISRYTDAFTMNEKEYERTLEENLPNEPGHGLRSILYVIYNNRDRDNINRVITEPAYDQFYSLKYGITDGYSNEMLLDRYNLGFGENNIRWKYVEDEDPTFKYTNRKTFNMPEIIAYNNLMRTYTNNLNNVIDNQSSHGFKLYNIGFYKNWLKANSNSNGIKDNEMYIYVKPTMYSYYTDGYESRYCQLDTYICKGNLENAADNRIQLGGKSEDIY